MPDAVIDQPTPTTTPSTPPPTAPPTITADQLRAIVGGLLAPAENPAAPPPPAPSAPPVPPPASTETVSIPAARLAELEAVARQAAEAMEQERRRKGEWDALLAERERQAKAQVDAIQAQIAERDRRIQQMTEESNRRVLGESLASSLAGAPLVSEDAAKQLLALLAPQFTVRDGVAIHAATGQPASDAVKTALASPSYAHFLRPTSSTGGAGVPGGQAVAPGATPLSPSDAWAAGLAARQGLTLGVKPRFPL